jgi:hypothetical protein
LINNSLFDFFHTSPRNGPQFLGTLGPQWLHGSASPQMHRLCNEQVLRGNFQIVRNFVGFRPDSQLSSVSHVLCAFHTCKRK